MRFFVHGLEPMVRFQGAGTGMRHPAKVFDAGIQCARLKVGMGGAPVAQVKERTDMARLQELFAIRP